MKKMTLLITLSNLLFIGAYCVLFPHAIFVHEPDGPSSLHNAIVLAMSIYAGLQLGGIWILAQLSEKLTQSPLGATLMRCAGLIAFTFSYETSILLAGVLLGFSHAVYYKLSRKLCKEIQANQSPDSGTGIFFNISISTNLAYLTFPFLGSFLIENRQFLETGKVIALVISSVLTIISTVLFFKVKNSLQVHTQSNSQKTQAASAAPNTPVADTLRLLGFIFPYAFIKAYIPLKIHAVGLSSIYNSYFLSTSTTLVMLTLFLGLKVKFIRKYHLRTYDYATLLAFAVTVVAVFVDVKTLFVLYCFWSILEAYQMPNLEHHLFSVRNYEDKVLHRLMILDGVACFVGPMIAAAVLS